MVRASKVKRFAGDLISLGRECMRGHSLACYLACCRSVAGGREGNPPLIPVSARRKGAKGKNATVLQFTHSYRKSTGLDS